MVYLILAIGIMLAVTGLYRYILKSSPRQIKALFLAVAAVGVGLAAFVFSITGKLPAAIAILATLWPIAVSYLRNRPASPSTSGDLPLTEKEAYEVLGLQRGANAEDIRAAHLRLMKKVHPDQKGSDWLAKKINAAKDLLLKQ